MPSKRSTFGRLYRRKRGSGYAPGFYVRLRVHGKEVTRWAGPDRKTAAEFLAGLLRRSAREDLLGEKVVPAVTLREFLPKLRSFLEAHHAPTTVEGDRCRLARIVAHFGERALCSVTTADVQEFLTGLRACRRAPRDGAAADERPPSAATRNRYASILSLVFRVAVEHGVAAVNPVVGIRRQREPRPPVPFISSADVDRLVAAAADPAFAALLRVLADTGLRRSEALRLEWRDLRLDRPVAVVRPSKRGRSREVPLTRKAKEAFETVRAAAAASDGSPGRLVWPQFQGRSKGAVEARFRRLRVRAGFPTMRLHDLRHAFCSRLAQEGVPLPTIAALAGHSSITTTARYAAHLPDDATKAAIARLEPPAPGASGAQSAG